MKKKSLRGLIIVLVAAMVFTMMPISVSAASNKPGKTKISSYKVGKVSSKNNKAKVVITWKKAKNATGYIIYSKHGTDKWRKAKKVGKRVVKLTVVKVSAGKVSFKVVPIRKVKCKTYKGKASKVKTKFIKSTLTLEQYAKKIEPEMYNMKIDEGTYVTVKGNTLVYNVNLDVFPAYDDIEPSMMTEAEKKELSESIKESEIKKNITKIQNNTGIKGITAKAVYTLKGVEVASKTYK